MSSLNRVSNALRLTAHLDIGLLPRYRATFT
jgi:hypothetical protein